MSGPENPRALPSAAINDQFGGMSLLDHFAGQALVGEMAGRTSFEPGWQEQVAWRCYSVARTMLAAREKGGDA